MNIENPITAVTEERRAFHPHIAFMGRAGSGKSTLAELLVKYLGYTRLSFAQPLKDVAAEIWGPGAKTDRDKLQRLGVAVREIHEDAWVNVLLRRFNELEPRGARVVVDDLRFPNEWYGLRGAGFKVVRVEAPLVQRRERLRANGKFTSEEQEQHVSETALDGFGADAEIRNPDAEIAVVWRELQDLLARWAR